MFIMTEDNLQELKNRIYEMENVDLIKAQQSVTEAVKDGDLRENQAYEIAMDNLKVLIAKIEEYYKAANTAKIVKYNPDVSTLQLDDLVELIDSQGNVYNKKLVGISPILGDPDKNEISIDSPVGTAIYGKIKGVTSVVVNRDVIEYRYRKIGHGDKQC